MSHFPVESWATEHDGRLASLIAFARAAGDSTLPFYETGNLQVEAKDDHSPVTIADRTAEQKLRKLVQAHYPDDEVMGEEFATEPGKSGYRWVVDPIDGTKSFVSGVPLYSTLLALEKDDASIGGVIYLPALDEIVVAAVGKGAWHRPARQTAWQAAHVSQRDSLSQAIFVTSQVDSFSNRGAEAGYRDLESAAWITRTWGDGYGYLLVATGRADIMIDPIVSPWDIAAIGPVIDEAGGRFTDWQGTPGARVCDAVGTNGALHEPVLEILKRQPVRRNGG